MTLTESQLNIHLQLFLELLNQNFVSVLTFSRTSESELLCSDKLLHFVSTGCRNNSYRMFLVTATSIR